MTVEEVFVKLESHMRDGVEYHQEMKRVFEFLGLWGYAKDQKHHCKEEMDGFLKLQHYYASHYFRLLQLEPAAKWELFPTAWYKYGAQAVDIGTKRNMVKELFGKWVEWEKNTKKLYEEMYLELTNLREIAAAIEVKKYITDVDKELSKAQKQQLNLEAIGYNLELIIDWQ